MACNRGSNSRYTEGRIASLLATHVSRSTTERVIPKAVVR